MKKLLVPFVVLALAVAVAAGCGGGGSSKNKAYANSVAAYAAALNAICAPGRAKAKALGIQSIADIAANGDKLKSLIQDSMDKIDALEPPAQVKATVEDYKAKVKDELSKFGDLVSAAKAGDAQKVQQIAGEIQADDVASNNDAQKIGASACAQG